ncbi:MAG: SIS domain-containing protein [Oscillospiraceae bacterium]|nr:SIS domain-containing protein [Oscillospiraceae bacterium]
MEYLDRAIATLKALDAEEKHIQSAQKIISAAVKENRLIHIFGTDTRSSALISEVFFRAGMPITIDPMLDPTLDSAHGAYRNQMAWEVKNLAPCILDYYERVEEGDPFILIGSDETLPMFAQSLQWAKEKKLRIITISDNGTDGEVSVSTHCGDDTYAIAVSAILNMMMDAGLPEEKVWLGKRTVDLDRNTEKIDKMLFRIRHL